MYHFKYVTKAEAAPVKATLISIIHEVQDILRDEFTFRYDFIGSSSRNMITCDLRSNKGYDFDVNIEVNDDNEEYSAKVIKQKLMAAFNKVIIRYGYNHCEDSTRVITIKFVDEISSKIVHSCDFAIVNHYDNNDGSIGQEYIRFNKKQGTYTWENQPKPYETEHKAEWLKQRGVWNEVLERYLQKKNLNQDLNKHSRALYAETIHEICQLYGYYD